jgi:hypothetical protein
MQDELYDSEMEKLTSQLYEKNRLFDDERNGLALKGDNLEISLKKSNGALQQANEALQKSEQFAIELQNVNKQYALVNSKQKEELHSLKTEKKALKKKVVELMQVLALVNQANAQMESLLIKSSQ